MYVTDWKSKKKSTSEGVVKNGENYRRWQDLAAGNWQQWRSGSIETEL